MPLLSHGKAPGPDVFPNFAYAHIHGAEKIPFVVEAWAVGIAPEGVRPKPLKNSAHYSVFVNDRRRLMRRGR